MDLRHNATILCNSCKYISIDEWMDISLRQHYLVGI